MSIGTYFRISTDDSVTVVFDDDHRYSNMAVQCRNLDTKAVDENFEKAYKFVSKVISIKVSSDNVVQRERAAIWAFAALIKVPSQLKFDWGTAIRNPPVTGVDLINEYTAKLTLLGEKLDRDNNTPLETDPPFVLDFIGHKLVVGDLVIKSHQSKSMIDRITRIHPDGRVHLLNSIKSVSNESITKIPDTPELSLYLLNQTNE